MEKSRISRRGMLKGAAAAVLALDGSVSAVSSAAAVEQLPLVQKTPVIGSKNVTGQKVEGSVAKVYFSPVIDAASLIKLYNLVNEEIYGKVAIKLHTGEPHGPNILPRDMVQALQKTIPNSTIVETNTLYGGGRENTADHRKTLEINGWSFCPVDIMDEHNNSSTLKLAVSDIVYVESMRDHQYIKLGSGEKVDVRMTLGEIEEKLASFDIVRVHKSFLVNYKYVQRLETSELLLTGGERVPPQSEML